MTSNECILKNTSGWNAVMSCEGELIMLCEIKLCFVWLELCINLTLGLPQTEHFTNGDQCKVICAVKETFLPVSV